MYNVPGALQFELASGIINKSLQKLVRVFSQINESFGDSKILRTCAAKIFQLSDNDQQKTQFYNYLDSKKIFGQKNAQKIYKSFILSLDNSRLVYQLTQDNSNPNLLLLVYTKLNQSDIRYQFLFDPDSAEKQGSLERDIYDRTLRLIEDVF